MIGRLETSAWQTAEEPSTGQKLSERHATAGSSDKNKKKYIILCFRKLIQVLKSIGNKFWLRTWHKL